MEPTMFDALRVQVPHRDPELWVSLAAAVVIAVFPQYADAAQFVLVPLVGRFSVRTAGAIARGRVMAATMQGDEIGPVEL